MKKEIREKVSQFKRRESALFIALNKEPGNPEVVRKLKAISEEITAWLQTIAGDIDSMSQEEKATVLSLIEDARDAILNAGKKDAGLNSYIADSARRYREPQPHYERIVDDKSQVAVLAEDSACEKVAKIEKFNKKRNRKPFLGIKICKFRKSKLQQSQENENSSNGPVNG